MYSPALEIYFNEINTAHQKKVEPKFENYLVHNMVFDISYRQGKIEGLVESIDYLKEKIKKLEAEIRKLEAEK